MTNLDVRPYVETLFARALAEEASDIHVEPTADGAEVRLRVDGLLQTIDRMTGEMGRSTVLRLMVLAQLLTYRLDIPQEGRVTWEVGHRSRDREGATGADSESHGRSLTVAALNFPEEMGGKRIDCRLAIMPTAHGLRAVVRMPADLVQPKSLGSLALPAAVMGALERFAKHDQGMLLVTGPAGSGKTTTIYALLEHIAAGTGGEASGLSIISLEDPVERLLPGVTQIEVTPHGQLTYERALKSILRQDPQVLMLGEIRDVATASIAVQAALSGHRLIATLHAGEPAMALARLLEMGIEPYQLTSSLFGILSQRLLRKRSSASASRYRGRVPVAEFAQLDTDVRAAVLQRADADSLKNRFAQQSGYVTMRTVAEDLVARGVTDEEEVQRVLGLVQRS
ncbi:MAG: Flp pilus assembly complex ATPase component TadA [Phycisphaerales bacterium]|nr:Flp pilus assembly complex ATPase component TadA [Phycisphaerales bacterium]